MNLTYYPLSASAAVLLRSHTESTLLPSSIAMADPCFGSAPPAVAPMTVEGSPPAHLADPSLAPAAGHYLPGNPLPYFAPSATHQPELLLLSWMIATLHTLVSLTPSLTLLLLETNRPTASTFNSATPYDTWLPSALTCAKASAFFNFCPAHRARQVTTGWTVPPVSLHPPQPTFSLLQYCHLPTNPLPSHLNTA